jgi:hypothetical protein
MVATEYASHSHFAGSGKVNELPRSKLRGITAVTVYLSTKQASRNLPEEIKESPSTCYRFLLILRLVINYFSNYLGVEAEGLRLFNKINGDTLLPKAAAGKIDPFLPLSLTFYHEKLTKTPQQHLASGAFKLTCRESFSHFTLLKWRAEGIVFSHGL